VLTTVILPPGVGHPGPLQPGLNTFPMVPLDWLDQLNSTSAFLEAIFCAQAWWLRHICWDLVVMESMVYPHVR